MNKALSIKLQIGLGLDRNGVLLSPAEVQAGLLAIRRTACRESGGCTVTRAEGSWRDETGADLIEDAAQVECLVFPLADESTEGLTFRADRIAGVIASVAKDVLRQNCVAYSRPQVVFAALI